MKTANMMSTPKGSVQVRCAPKPEEYQAGFRPNCWKTTPMPSEMMIDGTTRLATVR
ncbi:hypothetical protein D9M72_603510 [compost metagenome]